MKTLQLYLAGIFSTLLLCLFVSTTVFADPGTDGKIAAQAIPLDTYPPLMFYTPLSNTNSTGTRTLIATISDDIDGVPTSGIGLPVLYWKINAGIWHSAQGSFVSGNDYQFTFDGGANGDLISYYIVAQDGAATPNVGAYPSAGATGFTANPPACTSPPFFPSTYINNAIPPVISYTPLANTDGTGNRKLTATITDADGVPTSGAGLPVLYWKRNSGTYTPATGSFVSGNNYEFTFGAGVGAGDAVSYYIVARDMASTPNIISYKSEGAIGFSYDPPACSTPPSFPDSYLINNTPLSGDYTVGTTAFNKITGKNIYFEKEVKKVTKEIPEYEKLENNKGFTNKVIGTKKVEVEEIEWIPMENGKKYDGKLYALKAEHPEYDFPQTVNGTFMTITSAVSEINFRGVSGATRFLLADPSYTTGETFPISINIANNLPTSSNTVTIKPNTGVTTTISGAAVGALLKILNSYVTIDGSNTTNGTSRDLTIHNTATSASFPQVISVISPTTTPVTGSGVKNCIIINGDNGSSAVTLTDNSLSGGYFNNITLDNNDIQKAYYGIYFNAVASGSNGSGLVISNNTMNTSGANSIRLCGIYVQGVNGADISGNDIGNFETSADENDIGIWLGTGTKNAVIERNKIHSLGYTGPNNFGAQGINISSDVASANITVKNNVIYNISGYGNSYTTNPGYNPMGIYLHGTQSGLNVYDNSIYLYGNTLSRYQSISAGIGLGGTTSADIRNNNIVNNLGIDASPTSVPYGSVAIYAETGNTQFTDINYNNYHVNPTGTGIKAIGQLSTTVSTTLSAWKTATGKDAYSISDDPGFTSTTNLLPDNTNINSWNVFKKGIQIASINNDYTGSPRSITSEGGPTCIGAYEFATPTIAPPLLTVTSPAGGSTSNFIQSGRPVMDITWGALLDKGTNPQNKNVLTLPGTVTVQKYSGIPSPVSKIKLGKGYWKSTVDAEPTNPVSIKIHFGDEELGNITNPPSNIILSMYRQLTGQWVSFPAGTGNLQSNVDWANRTITVTGVGGTDRLLLNNAEYMLTDGTDVLDTDFPIITYTPLGNTSGTGARVLSTTITDAVSGVPASGIGLPVLYWKINTGSYTAVTAAYISGNNYEFTFGSGVTGGDAVSYYIVAQDLAATPNVGANPLAGASGFTANPPAALTPPTTPSSYHVDIVPPSISYTPLVDTSSIGARVLSTTITDALSGVPTSGIGLPVLYWKINAGVYTAATAAYISGNNYEFTFGAGVTVGDIVSYYIVAQDGAVTPNVGAYPSLGASGFTANPPAASTPPTTPGSYQVNAPPVILYTPLADINATGNRTLTATITDVDGVPVSGAGLPVLYWNRNTDAYTGVQATSLGSNQYSFTFGGGVSIGDLVHYYIVAQDMTNPIPKVTAYKLDGASGFTYNPPACSTPPISPDYYTITNTSLSGDYTVGTTAFNKITGKNIYFEKEVKKNTKEISWIPMENGKKYDGKLYALKAEHPEYDFPQTVNGTFMTITSAVSALNYQGVSGAVRFLLADPSYTTGETFPISINIANNLPTSTNTVTIKPNTGVTAVISGTAGGALLKILNSYVTIDGSNATNGTSRDLTIHNTATSASFPQVISVISQTTTPVENTGIKNCIIINGDNAGTSPVISAVTLTDISFSGGYFNNITLDNNDIQKAFYGIYLNAVATGTNGSGLVISNNTMNTSGANSLRLCGIYVQGVNGADISGNDIGNFETSTDGNDIGIWLGTGTKNAVIERNKIHSLGYTGPNNFGAQGINISSDVASANITVKNNVIYNISGYGNSYTTDPGYNPMGIYLHGTQSGLNVYDNSIYLYGNTLSRYQSISAGIGLGGTTSADIRNNNIVNNLGIDASPTSVPYGSVAIYAETGNTQFTDINYNNYHVNPTGTGIKAIGQLSTTVSTTLSAWKTATGKDAYSISDDPGFTSTTNLLPDNTNINSWNVFKKGIQIASINNDYTGSPRSITSEGGPTCIGAYEFATPTVAPPLLTVTSPAGGSTSNFIQSGRPVMDITWGALLDKGTNPQNKNVLTLPGTVTVQKYSGIPSPVSKIKLGKGYWKSTVDAEPTNPVSIKIHFGDEELGNITNPPSNIILSMYRQLTGQWVSFPAGTGNLQSNVDWANRTITVTGVGGTDRLLLNNAEYMLTDGTDVLDTDFPIITYTPLGNTSGTGARVLSTTITDAVSGVPASGIGLPVLYWKINTGSYTAVTAAYISGNNYEFTFGSGVTGGDAVSYYIVAQDLAATPNVGANPLAGASGFTANPPAALTPPTTPSSYHVDIVPPSISYTPLVDTSSIGARVLSTTITDALSGVPTSGIGLPVLYWKINAGVYTAATAAYISGNNYEFTFGAGVIGGDIVSYYIVAQDGAVTPNVGAYPSGASGFTANPPAASTPPTTPGSYLVNTPPVISYTALTDINATGNRTLTATITDADGVPTLGAGLPVLYWNRNTDAYTGVQATSLGSNQYSFTFGGGVSIGDLVHYYIVAQDMTNPIPKVTAYKLDGASGFTYNPPACSTPPTSPDYYLINSQSLSGDYTVGTTAFNKITGKNIYFEKEVKKDTKEISWIPMENGKKYDGKLYALKSEHPEYDFPQTVNGTFMTITSAVSALNYQGVSGATRFLLVDPSYTTGETFPIVINIANNLPTSTNTVTIKPNESNTAAITSSGAGPVFRIVSDYVTIDGSNTNNGTTRDLTITNNSLSSAAIQFISQGTTPVISSGVKNCTIINGDNGSSAVTLTDNSLSGGYFNNITLDNNDIQKAYYGIYFNAVASGSNGSGLVISNNTMNTSGANSIRLCGIYVQGANGADISGNDIGNFETLADENDNGIWLGTGTKNAVIERNKIYSLGYTGPNNFNYAAQGINISSDVASANITIKNNVIYDISGYGNSYTTNLGFNPMGIYLHGTQSGINVYYNSIYLYGNTLRRDHAISAGISLGSGTTSADIRNNNIVNNLGIHPSYTNINVYGSLGIYAETGNSQFTEINYNNYNVNPTSLGGPWVKAIGQLSATVSTTLSDWKTATGKDAYSISDDPGFTSTTDLLPDNTNIKSWNVFKKGIQIASINNDYTGNPRSITSAGGPTCIGAYEFAVPTVAPPLLTVTSPAGGSTSNFIQSGRPVMDITWGALLDKGTNPKNNNYNKEKPNNTLRSGGEKELSLMTLPGTVSVQKYSGIPSPGTKAKFGKGYWKTTVDAEPTNPVTIKIHFGDEELGDISNPETNIILTMYNALASEWISFSQGIGNLQSNVDWANRTITVNGVGGTGGLLLNDAEYMLTDATDPLDITPPVISYTPLSDTTGTGSRILTAAITDLTGVPTSGIGLPVLYWKINAGSYTAVTAAYISGNNYEFTFGAGVTGGDIVSYYIAAQDLAATPNVGAYPLAGASGFTANPPAASTPPSTPSSYLINGSPSLSLNLTAMLSGYCNGTAMNYTKDVTVELHNATTPHALVESRTVTLSSSGLGNPVYTTAVNGTPYYIVLKFNNGLETWSATPQTFTGSTLNYDFTTAATQAYGSNMVLVGSKWCVISGDANQDGSVDALDRSACWNDRNLSGVYVTDLNGDGVVDALDRSIAWNNRNLSVQKPALVLSPIQGVKQDNKGNNGNTKGTFDLRLDGSNSKKVKKTK